MSKHLAGFRWRCPLVYPPRSQRAAQCYGILISIFVFPIKPHYMKLLLHASTQIQFSDLRICISIFLSTHWFTDSFCILCTRTVFCTYSTSVGISYLHIRIRVYGIRCTCTVHTLIGTFAHIVSVSLLLHCNRRSVHNFDLGLNWRANLKILL